MDLNWSGWMFKASKDFFDTALDLGQCADRDGQRGVGPGASQRFPVGPVSIVSYNASRSNSGMRLMASINCMRARNNRLLNVPIRKPITCAAS